MGLFLSCWLARSLWNTAKAVIDSAEDIANDGAEDHKDSDNDNGNQNKNQRILDQALAFFFGWE